MSKDHPLLKRGAEALFGFSTEEALGQSLDLIIPERLRGGFNGAMTSGTTRLEKSSSAAHACEPTQS
jgi:hypothetical protein